ncbi:hypothetical protein [Micromonospora sp. NPDC005806]|uniref:hypothetical protein n=1 Tax=Micromonospora sp. NPDC005806 TaxID=3364234 RepID=UPI00369027CC
MSAEVFIIRSTITGDPKVEIRERFEVELDFYPAPRRPGPAIIEHRPSVTIDLGRSSTAPPRRSRPAERRLTPSPYWP